MIAKMMAESVLVARGMSEAEAEISIFKAAFDDGRLRFGFHAAEGVRVFDEIALLPICGSEDVTVVETPRGP